MTRRAPAAACARRGAPRTALLSLLLLTLSAVARGQDPLFIRGNANGDASVDLADSIFILSYTFLGGRAPPCLDAADINDDARVDISDAIYLLNYLFSGSRRPPRPPYPDAGADPTPDSLGCRSAEAPIRLRHGTLVELEQGVGGDVAHMSDRTIRLTHFYYDGGGIPSVVIVLHKTLGAEQNGTIISPDLLGQEFDDATLVYDIPPEVADTDFDYVSVWCTSIPLNYGYAYLFRN